LAEFHVRMAALFSLNMLCGCDAVRFGWLEPLIWLRTLAEVHLAEFLTGMSDCYQQQQRRRFVISLWLLFLF